MHLEIQFMRGFRLVRREAAERHLFTALLSFAASVSLVRLFLALTGYPQIGGGEFHIAHVLWGGLLLFAAALLPLLLANRWVYTAGALLAGVGVGLFIDEVGKFITQRNDYFYPAAAPIIYTFFLFTILLLFNVRRFFRASAYPELSKALEEMQELVDHALTPKERALLASRLDNLARNSPSERHADLGRALLRFVESDPRPSPATQADLWWTDLQQTSRIPRLASDDRLRVSLAIGILAIGLLTLKNPGTVLLAGWLPPEVNNFLANLHFGRQTEAAVAPLWFAARVLLELIVGSLLVASAALLAVGRTSRGAALGYAAVLLSLTTVNLLLFYFEQFSTIITTTIQFLLLFGIIFYRRRLTTG